MSEARNINTFNKKRFIKGLTISLLIVLAIESFRLTRISDHNGEKFLAINMSRLGDMGDKSGLAIVLQPHTIRTDYGDLRLKMFCSITRIHGKFSSTENHLYKHNLEFFGQPITGDKQVVMAADVEPFLTVHMFSYEREKFLYYGQEIIPLTFSFNYFLQVKRSEDDKEYSENGYEISTPEYKYKYYKGVSFYSTYTDVDSSPIRLKDGSILYSEAIYVIQAPENEEWTIELDGDINYEKYIQFVPLQIRCYTVLETLKTRYKTHSVNFYAQPV